MRHTTFPGRSLRSAALIVGAAALTACGGGDGDTEVGDEADAARVVTSILDEIGFDTSDVADGGAIRDEMASDAADGGFSTSPQPVTQTWDTDVTGWWDAWTINVDSVEATSDDVFSSIVVSLTVVNHGDEVRTLHNGTYALELNGAVAETGFFSDPPQVAAGGTTSYDLDFTMRGAFDLERARFVFGRPSENQAMLPLGGGPVEAFEPIDVEVAGDLTTSVMLAEVTGPAHVAPSFAPGDRGRYVVRIPMSLAYTGEGAGGVALMPTQFVLEAPDGSSAVGEPLARGDIIAEPLPKDGAPQPFSIAFRTGEPQSGTYRVIFTDADGESATVTFEMPG